MHLLFQIEIPKRTPHCFHKGERLSPGMEIYSLLTENEVHEWDRRDFCSTCWKDAHSISEKLQPQIYWKSKIEIPKKTEASSKISKALNLLRQLLQSSEQQETEIFILCLFLSHARQIVLRKEFQDEGASFHLYEILQDEEFITIKAPKISHIQIETIQKSIANKLQAA